MSINSNSTNNIKKAILFAQKNGVEIKSSSHSPEPLSYELEVDPEDIPLLAGFFGSEQVFWEDFYDAMRKANKLDRLHWFLKYTLSNCRNG